MSSFGKIFKITTFGESHGLGVGCIIENVPPRLKLSKEDIQPQLDRRKPNQNSLLSTRQEPDVVEIYSGLADGVTLGTPLMLMVKNIDFKPLDYKSFSTTPRPGHADLTYLTKYGVKAASGGGRASARETVARVAAGAVAEIYLKDCFKTHIVSWVSSVGDIQIPTDINMLFIRDEKIDKSMVDLLGAFSIFNPCNLVENKKYLLISNNYTQRRFLIERNANFIEEIVDEKIKLELSNNINGGGGCRTDGDEIEICRDFLILKFRFFENVNVRCPHVETAMRIILEIMSAKDDCDSIGGIVTCVIRNTPQSLGEPCFDKFEAELGKAMLSIPATKGFEIGSGFAGTKMR